MHKPGWFFTIAATACLAIASTSIQLSSAQDTASVNPNRSQLAPPLLATMKALETQTKGWIEIMTASMKDNGQGIVVANGLIQKKYKANVKCLNTRKYESLIRSEYGAIKKLDPLKRAGAAARTPGLNNIVLPLQAISAGNSYCFVYDYNGFQRLNQYQFPPDVQDKANVQVHIVKELIAGLALINKAGLAHNDLRPENVLISLRPGEDAMPRVAIMNFAAAVSVNTALTGADQVTSPLATYREYAPPEFYTNQPIDPKRKDMWSVGAILLYLMTGKRTPSALMGGLSAYAKYMENLSKKGIDKELFVKASIENKTGSQSPLIALLGKLLVADQSQRPSANEYLNPGMKEPVLSQQNTPPPTPPRTNANGQQQRPFNGQQQQQQPFHWRQPSNEQQQQQQQQQPFHWRQPGTQPQMPQPQFNMPQQQGTPPPRMNMPMPQFS
ncbi:kinase-like domain-containing protein [Syncephalis pseudoplumigaleata]|uniref:Kinase-like domain-containing protein n=1 Tax=Syncephalis pseudoplumigaleata TaxID=1712513 RepID=A0A4P9YYY7_9FUNG|nr:kinase-like domain-containing protein [Syncephalis pseudoplumigaleata]|eukprot:RKP25155.1 kinase-like domain-containing protein [Syncephalis pseudoplumigaleata]